MRDTTGIPGGMLAHFPWTDIIPLIPEQEIQMADDSLTRAPASMAPAFLACLQKMRQLTKNQGLPRPVQSPTPSAPVTARIWLRSAQLRTSPLAMTGTLTAFFTAAMASQSA